MFSIFDSFWESVEAHEVAVILPPIESFGQYFSDKAENGIEANPPTELINFDIALVSLAKSKDLNDQISINYIAKFVEHFCPDLNNENYSKLSTEGKERVESILNSSSAFIKEAIKKSGCNAKP